jgi:thioredoxin 1
MLNHDFESREAATNTSSSSDRIQTVTRETFDALVLEGQGPIAVEFMSYGCAHCRVIEPILQQVATAVAPAETIFRVNTAVEPELAESYEIEGTPTLVMFWNGQEVGRAEGPSPIFASVQTLVTQPFATGGTS